MSWLLKFSTPISVSMKRQTFLTDAFNSVRTWLVVLVGLITQVSTLWICSSYAIGPTLPLRFEDMPQSKAPLVVDLLVEPEQIRVVRIERHVYADGKKLRVEPIEAKYEQRSVDKHIESRVQLPLHVKEMVELKQTGAFAQKIVVEGQWLKEPSAKPLHLERWFYFIVKGNNVRRLGLEEYSNLTDRVEVAIDSSGRQGLVHRGRDLEAVVPLPKTKSTPAIPVGPLGGAAEERLPTEGKRSIQEMDRSEADEK